ncbi:MAG: sigma-54-dependent Fis family transcriptional regulator [Candidatus Hydrogenedens sp.]|nr:sigma-54-dependent Fis family transcriptional regulator [Candidatus Hydrogenedentota bacterium]NLF57781.1 sigma-54-dependent Fis family transcriptional regulator [Candidatus Hydrogenedens sp.]
MAAPRKPVIMVVDDEPAQRILLRNALESAGYGVLPRATGEEALGDAAHCDLMLLDVRLPGMDGLEVLRRLRQTPTPPPVMLLTAYMDLRDAVAAVKDGALDYLEKPVDLDELLTAIEDILGGPDPGDCGAPPPGVVAESAAMRGVLREARRAAPSNATVLLLGESGTGKEVLARLIHQWGPGAAGPWVAVNCGAIPAALFESHLFGHEKGAFTGADAAHRGCLEEARGGSLFLDEIGEMPLEAQPKLLRALESGMFRPVGAAADRHSDARIVAATNRDLEAAVAAGEFREDLYYRINVFPIHVPPLRERRDDILPLAAMFLRGRHKRLSPAAERLMAAHDWPGNARELRNAVERAAILSAGALILPDDLPPAVRRAAPGAGAAPPLSGGMEAVQKRAILDALEETGGNKTRAAERLGISRRSLVYKLRSYGM